MHVLQEHERTKLSFWTVNLYCEQSHSVGWRLVLISLASRCTESATTTCTSCEWTISKNVCAEVSIHNNNRTVAPSLS
ncbi:unnamed protein product [Calypogeia fissa]